MGFVRCIFFIAIALCSFYLYASDAHSNQSIQVKDFQTALEMSRDENKTILLFFNGSDWSVEGMKMKKEIFDTPGFHSCIQDKLLIVEVDFPQHSSLGEVREAFNLKLKQRFRIEEIPFVVVLDSHEREITRLGYVPEKGIQFGEDLLHIIQMDKTMIDRFAKLKSLTSQELKELYQITEELQRTDLFDEILEAGIACEDPHFFLLEKYRLLVNAGKMTSYEAEMLKEKMLGCNEMDVHFSLALIDFQGLSKSSEIKEPKIIVSSLEKYLEKFGERDLKNVWQIEMMIAQVYLDYDQWQSALDHAEIAFHLAPVEVKEEIEHSVNYIRHQTGQIANK